MRRVVKSAGMAMLFCVISYGTDVLAQAQTAQTPPADASGAVVSTGQPAAVITEAAPSESDAESDSTAAPADDTAPATDNEIEPAPTEAAPAAESVPPPSPTPVVVVAPPPKVETPAPKVEVEKPEILQGTWTKSIMFATSDGSFRFQPRGWVQPIFNLSINPDDDNVVPGTGFGLQRARFGFQAYLFKWGHTYLDTGFKSGTGKLIDFFLDLGPENGSGAIAIRAGYFRPYYCRQLLEATTKLAMVDYAKAWTDKSLGLELGRDVGVGLYGFVANGFEYGVGIWNGNMSFSGSDYGEDSLVKKNGNTDLQTGGRIAIHPLSLGGVGNPVKIDDESDSEMSDKPGLAIGASAMFDKLANRGKGAIDPANPISATPVGEPLRYNGKAFRLGTDLAFKYQGFSFQGELFFVKRWADEDTDAEEVISAELERRLMDHPGIGAYVQMGYFIVPKSFELVVRFDTVDENVEMRGIRFYPTMGITYFIFGNNLKVQAQYRVNVGTEYEDIDPGYIPVSHDLMLMLQFSI